MLTVSHFDSLGSGAMLAYILNTKNKAEASLFSFFNKISPLTLLMILGVFYYVTIIYIPGITANIIIVLISVTLIIGSIIKFNGIIGYILNSPIMIYLGRISYGLYLFHKPIPYFFKLILSKIINYDPNKYILFISALLLTIILSHLSFVIVESRFIKIKSRFDL